MGQCTNQNDSGFLKDLGHGRRIFDPANELADCTVLSYCEIKSIVRHVGNRWCGINETARVHFAPRQRRGRVAVCRARTTAAQDAACRLCRYAASRVPTLYHLPQADGRTGLSGRPEFYFRLHPNTEYRWLRKKLSRARVTQG